MRRLCFGTYARVVQKVMKPPNGNKDITEMLLSLIIDNVDITNQRGDVFVVTDKMASELLSHKTDVLKKIRDASATAEVIDSALYYFEDVVIPGIMPDLVEDLLADMRQLILSDHGIPKRKQSELLGVCDTSSLAEFLSDVYLYAIKQRNKIVFGDINMEVGGELTPALLPRKHSIPESDLYLLLETDSICPKCGKSLVNLKNGHSLAGYTITEIVPTHPTESVRETLGDLLEDTSILSQSENSIALCLDCSNSYSQYTDREECRALRTTKEKLRRNYDAAVMLDKMYLEEQIESILRSIPIDSVEQITETLEYTALRVRDKISSNVPLIIKTEGFVVQYYKFIKSVFSQLEREGNIDFDGVASDVKRSYKKLHASGYSQEEIYAHLVDWFMKKTNTKSILPCEIIVAFFVQNCEVFHAISK